MSGKNPFGMTVREPPPTPTPAKNAERLVISGPHATRSVKCSYDREKAMYLFLPSFRGTVGTQYL